MITRAGSKASTRAQHARTLSSLPCPNPQASASLSTPPPRTRATLRPHQGQQQASTSTTQARGTQPSTGHTPGSRPGQAAKGRTSQGTRPARTAAARLARLGSDHADGRPGRGPRLPPRNTCGVFLAYGVPVSGLPERCLGPRGKGAIRYPVYRYAGAVSILWKFLGGLGLIRAGFVFVVLAGPCSTMGGGCSPDATTSATVTAFGGMALIVPGAGLVWLAVRKALWGR